LNPPKILPVTFNAPVPETNTAVPLVLELGPVRLPLRLKVPPVENVMTLALTVVAVCAMIAATLAEFPTPRLGVVMQLVVVAP
jgi:hypothetical protein